MRKIAFIISIATCCVCPPAGAQQVNPADTTETAEITESVSAPAMRRQFEGLYLGWREAMVKKELETWQKVTATSRQMETRNRIVSQKLPYPAALFAVPMQAPDLKGLLHVDVLARGDTASAIYFGKADFGVSDSSEVADNFIVLRFVREFGVWKFDNVRVVRIREDTGILLQIRNRDLSFLEGAEFQPARKTPALPRTVNQPDLIAEVRIRSVGYETTVEINNQHSSTIANDDGRDLVIGGLNIGNNLIRIVTKPVTVEAGMAKTVEIGIYGTEAADKPARRVYHFRINPGEEVPEEVSSAFAVQKAD